MINSYSLSNDTWNNDEIKAIYDVIKSNRYTMANYVKTFEESFAHKVGSKYAVMSNSGSSANLLMISALFYSKKLQLGDEVIVPAVSWSTTYSPLSQYGLKIKFVDIDLETLNINLTQLKSAITPKTKMLFAVNLLGNPNHYDAIISLCKENNLILIEDNCESYGGTYGNKQLGTIGLMGSFSLFYSHHLCTMEGGITVTDDPTLYEYMLSIRAHGWTRNLPPHSNLHKPHNNNFYENFNFILPGYNLRPIEMEGAIGLVQLSKSDDILIQRRNNASYFLSKMSSFSSIRTQKEISNSSWFGFAMTLIGDLENKRDNIVEHLQNNNIEVRPIVAGNFTKHKACSYMNYSIHGKLKNADYIHDNGFFIGNHSSDLKNEIDYFFNTLREIQS